MPGFPPENISIRMTLCRFLFQFDLVVPSVGFGHLELYCLPGLLDAIMLASGGLSRVLHLSEHN